MAPALFVGGQALSAVWIYWVGPLIGAALGAIIYELMRGGKNTLWRRPLAFLLA